MTAAAMTPERTTPLVLTPEREAFIRENAPRGDNDMARMDEDARITIMGRDPEAVLAARVSLPVVPVTCGGCVHAEGVGVTNPLWCSADAEHRDVNERAAPPSWCPGYEPNEAAPTLASLAARITALEAKEAGRT